jgi:transposase
VIGKYQAAAQHAGLSWPLPEALDDDALANRLSSKSAESVPAAHVAPDFVSIHEQLKEKGVTRLLLWEEYRAAHPDESYSYSQFCFHYQQWQSRLKLVMRQTHRAGEKLFVDYAGPTVPIVNPITGEIREAQIFVAVLGASNYTYAEATWTQGLADWIGAHTRAFSFFGGVPALVVPDNPRSGVTKACRYEPLLNSSYQQMLAHYGTAALPARPYKPRDKAYVSYCTLCRFCNSESWLFGISASDTFDNTLRVQRFVEASPVIVVALLLQQSLSSPGTDCSRRHTKLRAHFSSCQQSSCSQPVVTTV